MGDHKVLAEDIGFSKYLQSSAIGSSREIVIMWNEMDLNIIEILISQCIHVSIKLSNSLDPWFVSFIYSSTILEIRKAL